MKKAIVTGARGQDAYYLTKLLLSKNYEVILTTRKKDNSFYRYLKENFKSFITKESQLRYLEVDCLNESEVLNLVSKNEIDEIYNLTGHSNIVSSFKSPNSAKNEPVKVFNNFIKAIKSSEKETRFFQASTSEIFKDIGTDLIDENSETKATSPYAIGKLKVHNLLQKTRDETGMYLVSGIMFNHESLIRNKDYLFGYIAHSINEIKEGKIDKFYISNLNTVRDWGYSEDFVQAMWLSLNNNLPTDYIISTGKSYSVKEILHAAFKEVGLNYQDYIIEKFDLTRSYDIEKKYSNPSKIYKELSWKAKLDGVEVIKKIVNYEVKDIGKSKLNLRKIPESKFINVYQPSINKSDEKHIISALNRSNLSGASSEVQTFEYKFKEKYDLKYSLAVNNGTAALHLALLSLDIQKGDEVIIPSLTFIATANAVSYVGAKPIIVDIDPDTLQISVEDIKRNINKKTKAIIPVHLYGNCPDLNEIKKLANKHNLYVVHDSAEALGTKYKGKASGSFSDIAIYSFYPNKLITTGEGGMLVTSNRRIYELAKKIRSQGVKKNADEYIHDIIGYNYRMNSLSAALGISQLQRIDNLLDRKKEIFLRYKEKLEKHGISFIETKKDVENSYWLVVAIFNNSKIDVDKLREFLYSSNIETKKIFFPIERQKMYDNKRYNKNAYDIYLKSVCLPSSPDLKNTDVDYISEKIIKYLELN